MSDFISQNLSLAQTVASTPWLNGVRQQAQHIWQQQSLPTHKVEDWKYTTVRPLKDDYSRFAEPTDVDVTIEQHYAVPGLATVRLVFVNGHFSSTLSANLSDIDLPAGAELVRFDDANEQQQALITQHLNSVLEQGPKAKSHIFASLNNSQLDDGVLLYLPKNAQLEQPLEIVHVTTAQPQPFVARQRMLVILEQAASASVLEQFVSTAEVQNSFTHGITEAVLADNAQLHHYRLNMEQEDALHIGGIHVNQSAHSVFNSFLLGLGGRLKRIDLVVNHNGSGSHCEMNGIYLPKNKQKIDYHTNVEHRVPHCTTNEIFRGIMADASKAVFNGRIHIHPDAQKTLADMSNKNLLLSNEAEIKTKPELEIYADDVRCTHGATVSQIEDKAMYYMQSRGISRREAEIMLSFGFINELLNEVKLEPLQHVLRPLLAKLFTKDSELTRHLY